MENLSTTHDCKSAPAKGVPGKKGSSLATLLRQVQQPRGVAIKTPCGAVDLDENIYIFVRNRENNHDDN
jgi:hypothetical protein